MAAPNEEWLTQEAIAQMLDVPIHRVRAAITTLAGLQQIRTMRDPKDKRYVLVHRDSVPLIRQAVFGIQ